MKRRRVRINAPNPFLIWSGLALKTSEMMVASAEVISHRASRMAMSGVVPSEYDQREFVLKSGWATIAASDAPNGDLAEACAKLLIKPLQT